MSQKLAEICQQGKYLFLDSVGLKENPSSSRSQQRSFVVETIFQIKKLFPNAIEKPIVTFFHIASHCVKFSAKSKSAGPKVRVP